MPAFLEPLTYVIRFGPDAHHYGDPASGTGTVTIDHHGVATIRGLAGQMTRALRNDIITALREAGHDDIRWWRKKQGVWIEHKA